MIIRKLNSTKHTTLCHEGRNVQIRPCKREKLIFGFEVCKLQNKVHFCFDGSKLV